MKVAVIVNNYNYGKYVGQAIDSLRRQSLQPDHIVVVDDGSTDDSLDVIRRATHDLPMVEIIAKENGGQLSALNAAIAVIDSDIVTFLDSDDWYDPEYLSAVVNRFKEANYSFLFSNSRTIEDGVEKPTPELSGEIGMRYLRTIILQKWFGVATSMISFRTDALKKILPYPDEQNWKTRADDVLVFSAGLLNLRGAYLSSKLVNYRCHGGNLFAGKEISRSEGVSNILARVKFIRPELELFRALPNAIKARIFRNEIRSAIENGNFVESDFIAILNSLKLNIWFWLDCRKLIFIFSHPRFSAFVSRLKHPFRR